MFINGDKLNPFFKDSFSILRRDYLLPDENINWMGDIAEDTSDKSPYFG
ncbi:hypothetical protein SDC9_96663 [bioreactor metagenome]|uniref:Uncharacterized protein n=1 Tax=bioreactor metagenome TaxID=1076179 RepID=A0A645A9Q7_9ZZZZ